MNILMIRMFSSAHALIVNSTVGKKQKQKASSRSDSIRNITEQVLFSIRKSLQAWAWRLQIHYSLSCTQSNADVEQLYPSLSSNILMNVEKLLLMDIT